MNKMQWKNLWHSYRWMRTQTDHGQSIAWIEFYNRNAANLLRQLISE